MQFRYEYDKIGNIVSEVRTEEDQTNNRTYEYDQANQLVGFTDNNYAETYTYDNVGNMLTKNINDVQRITVTILEINLLRK